MQPNTMELECKNNVRGVKICCSMTEKEYGAVFVMSRCGHSQTAIYPVQRYAAEYYGAGVQEQCARCENLL